MLVHHPSPGVPAPCRRASRTQHTLILILCGDSVTVPQFRKKRLKKFQRQLDCCKFTHSPVCLNNRAKNFMCQLKHQVAAGPEPALPDLCHHGPFAHSHILNLLQHPPTPPSEQCTELLTPSSASICAWLCT